MEGLAYVEGRVADLKDARVPLLDRGYLLGDGVFETLRTSNGRVFRRDDHTARLRQGLRAIGLDGSLAALFDEAVDALVEAGRRDFGDELYLRIQVTTGPMEDIGGRDEGAAVTGIVRPFRPYPMQYYAKGVQVVFADQRKVRADPLSVVKSLSFLPYIAARRQALAATAHDAILLNDAGRVAEATTSNLFAVKDGKAYAPGPDEGALEGVTRAVVLELLQDTGITVEPRLLLETLAAADEVFLTNTTGGVVPVTQVAERTVGDGAKGELTTRLGHAYEDLVRGGNDHDA